MQKVVFSILVDNTSGVLSRIAGLFSRRGYNIDSLTVGVTADPRYSRATVVTKGDQQILDQIEKQLNKLEDVVDIKRLDPDNSVCRELLLVKVLCDEKNRRTSVWNVCTTRCYGLLRTSRHAVSFGIRENRIYPTINSMLR